MKWIKKIIFSFLSKFLTKEKAEFYINKIAAYSNTDLLSLAHRNIGIMKFENPVVSGEAYFLEQILPGFIKSSAPILFDVGANVGDYSVLLSKHFINASIFAFEPNPETYNSLSKRFNQSKSVMPVSKGLGNEKKSSEIFTYSDNNVSEHATVFKSVLTDLHKAKEVKKFSIEVTSIDDYCFENNIQKIDFLKIDTEGYEFEVLKGATKMITNDLIYVIQFEFNEMNIVSRVFLKDFYDLLKGYRFYRLNSNNLILLEHYNSVNEIFRFQNIIAINRLIY